MGHAQPSALWEQIIGTSVASGDHEESTKSRSKKGGIKMRTRSSVAPVPSNDSLYRRSKPSAIVEEALIRDARAEMTPAQMVERKLVSLLNGTPLPLSQIRVANLSR